MRALLIPKRQLAGELRILIDAVLDLLPAVNHSRLRKVVDLRCPVVIAIAAARNPPYKIVPVRGGEGVLRPLA
jgi:hypothetical protein